MPRYKIRCYDSGVWDGLAPTEVEAATMKEAAEIVCGGPLCDSVADERLRAAVWIAGSIPEHTYFYLMHDGAAKPSRPPTPLSAKPPERSRPFAKGRDHDG